MAEEDYRDELPEELDVSGYVGPYHFPNNNRRRISAAILAVAGVALIALYAGYGQGVLVNRGFLVGGILMLLLAGYHLVAGATLRVSETDALVVATRTVGFPIGHASAQLSWRGLISRPTWRILLYSADEPPTKRGLVLVSGITGQVGEQLVEDNPEDWSDMDR
jgi:drug/metabolite transporter (DMT)-like permease